MLQQHKKFTFKTITDAPLTIYQHPLEDDKYTIGVDTATGLATDYTVFSVLCNRLPFEQVAIWRAKMTVHQAAQEMVNLGWYYNTALLVIETNPPGNSFQAAAIETYGYPNNYQAEQHLDEDPNISTKYGWATTQPSKWLLIREMQDALNKGDIVLNNPKTIDEFCNYVYIEDKTKTGAAEGLCDDCVIATMLAYHGAMILPQRHKPMTKEFNLTEGQFQMRHLLKRHFAKIRGKPKHIRAV